VRSPGAQADRVRDAIGAALRRRAEREARHITVEVTSPGTVALRGHVRSWLEKRAALWAARCAPGIHDVEDHIEIDPSR
jgi:osmotically-inducible protein OsmY